MARIKCRTVLLINFEKNDIVVTVTRNKFNDIQTVS